MTRKWTLPSRDSPKSEQRYIHGQVWEQRLGPAGRRQSRARAERGTRPCLDCLSRTGNCNKMGKKFLWASLNIQYLHKYFQQKQVPGPAQSIQRRPGTSLCSCSVPSRPAGPIARSVSITGPFQIACLSVKCSVPGRFSYPSRTSN